ncbi:MAG: chorismate lyase [Legionella sp.]|nr:chorismate lyase [Legionella sp.]
MTYCIHENIKDHNKLSTWINHQHSLTDKLQAIHPDIVLKRMSQEWTKPSWWDTHHLKIYTDALFQREVILYSQNIAYWYAKTIIPKPCYDLNPAFFNRLERESLRNLIFDGQEVHRVHRSAYLINDTCIEFYWVKKYFPQITQDLWVRFSEYSYKELSFYLLEMLFPELGALEA